MIYEESRILERIHHLMHRLGLNPRAFANEIGNNSSNIYKILSGERGLPKGFTSAILTKYPQVNKDWLLFGEGLMFVDDEPKGEFPKDTRPRLPKSVSGGHLTDYYEGEKRKLCQEKKIVTQFADYDFSLILKNNRMSPKYDRGDELFFKKSTIIEWGNDILLDTSEGPKFKKIMDAGDSVLCKSHNVAEYPDFLVPKNLIYGYYKCVGVLRIL